MNSRGGNIFWTVRQSGTTFWLLAILSFISFVATAWGTLELIQSNFLGGRTFGTFRLIDYPVLAFAASLLAVIQLVLLYTVKLCYSRHAPLVLRLAAFAGYLVCLCITAGFGFGFWWKLFVANEETLASTRLAVESVGAELTQAASRLDGLKLALGTLRDYSERRAKEEATRGGTCGTSAGLPGPRQRRRAADAAKFDSVATFVTKQLSDVQSNIDRLQDQFRKLTTNDPSIVTESGSRESFIENISYLQTLAVNSFNNLATDPILLKAREEFEARAQLTEFTENTTRFSCPDPELSAQLNRINASIDSLTNTKLSARKITITEGPKAVAYALARLWNTVSTLASKCRLTDLASCQLPPSSAQIRESSRSNSLSENGQKEAEAGLGKEDILPLGFGVAVDILILFFGYVRFRGAPVPANTREFVARMDSCFRQAFDRPPTPAERLLPIKASAFDRWTGHYAAVPIDFLDYASVRSPTKRAPRWANRSDGRASAEEGEDPAPTMQEAQYLDNVFTVFKQAGFVRLLGPFGRLANLVTENSARRLLEQRNSFFANAPSLKIYKFYPDAYAVIMEHFLTHPGEETHEGNRYGSDRTRQPGTTPTDRFPKGFSHEI